MRKIMVLFLFAFLFFSKGQNVFAISMGAGGGGGSGDMTKAVYDSNSNNVVDNVDNVNTTTGTFTTAGVTSADCGVRIGDGSTGGLRLGSGMFIFESSIFKLQAGNQIERGVAVNTYTPINTLYNTTHGTDTISLMHLSHKDSAGARQGTGRLASRIVNTTPSSLAANLEFWNTQLGQLVQVGTVTGTITADGEAGTWVLPALKVGNLRTTNDVIFENYGGYSTTGTVTEKSGTRSVWLNTNASLDMYIGTTADPTSRARLFIGQEAAPRGTPTVHLTSMRRNLLVYKDKARNLTAVGTEFTNNILGTSSFSYCGASDETGNAANGSVWLFHGTITAGSILPNDIIRFEIDTNWTDGITTRNICLYFGSSSTSVVNVTSTITANTASQDNVKLVGAVILEDNLQLQHTCVPIDGQQSADPRFSTIDFTNDQQVLVGIAVASTAAVRLMDFRMWAENWK